MNEGAELAIEKSKLLVLQELDNLTRQRVPRVQKGRLIADDM